MPGRRPHLPRFAEKKGLQQMTDPENDENWLYIDAFSNALDYLKKARIALSDGGDPFRWKWATIGLSSALYGFLICMLTGANWERVVDMNNMPKEYKEQFKKRLEMLGGGYGKVNPRDIDTNTYCQISKIVREFLHSGQAKLISFDKALKRAQNPAFLPFSEPSHRFSLSESQVTNIIKLRKHLRNEFEHFKPKFWVIEVACFVPMLRDTLDAVGQVSNSFNLRVGYREQIAELQQEVDALRKIVDSPSVT